MANQLRRVHKSKWPGVYCYESKEQKNDLCYYITYKVDGRKRTEKVGWSREGYTAAVAAEIRGQRMKQGRHGATVKTAAENNKERRLHDQTLAAVKEAYFDSERGRNLKKMGQDAQDTAELFFDNVRVPKENVLGEPGKGFYYLMEGLAEERLISACGTNATARHAFDITRDYVSERMAFGKPISEQQNTQFRMAELDTAIDMVQAYIDMSVAEHNAGRLTAEMGAKAKLAASEVEAKMVDLGVQLHGGAGYMEEYEICRLYRDTRISRIYAGSSEIMKLIIGREIFSQKYRSMLG